LIYIWALHLSLSRSIYKKEETVMNKLILISSIAAAGLMTPAFAQQSAPMDSAPPAQSEVGSPGATGSMNERSATSSNTRMGSADDGTTAISAQNLDTEKVREVQQALKDKSNADLSVDGMWGPQTQDAIRDFQRAENLDPSNGQLDEKTVSALGLDPDDFAGR